MCVFVFMYLHWFFPVACVLVSYWLSSLTGKLWSQKCYVLTRVLQIGLNSAISSQQKTLIAESDAKHCSCGRVVCSSHWTLENQTLDISCTENKGC